MIMAACDSCYRCERIFVDACLPLIPCAPMEQFHKIRPPMRQLIADVHQPLAVVRHLGLIKALAIIMAVDRCCPCGDCSNDLPRLQAGSANRARGQSRSAAGAHVSAAPSDKSGWFWFLTCRMDSKFGA